MNFGFKNNVTGPENDVKLKMCQLQKELDSKISNETNFQTKLQNLNLEQFKLKKLLDIINETLSPEESPAVTPKSPKKKKKKL